MLSGRAFTAEEMEKCGFVNRVVSRDRLEKEALEIASVIALQPLELLIADKYYLEVMREMRHPAAAPRVAGYAHLISTSMKLDPGDYAILPETTKKGAGGAIKEREKRYPPKYRLSQAGRAAKE